MDVYKEIEAKERAEIEREHRKKLEENEYKRKRDLEYLKDKYYGKSKGEKGIEIEYQKSLEEQKEIEKEILRKKEELIKLEEYSKLRKFQTALREERKFFFSLLFLGLLILAIFCLFKNPLYFPGLTNKVFWSLIILTFIIVLYYLGFFNFLKDVDKIRREQDNKIRENNKEIIKIDDIKSNKEEKREKAVKMNYIESNQNKINKENKDRAVKMYKIDNENINIKQNKSHKKGFFSRIINRLADK